MPVLNCTRCHRANPEEAYYCYFDGAELRPGQVRAAHRLPQEFVFPSGRCCQTFDELAQACQEEWAQARELLVKGVFSKHFQSVGRLDLMRAAEDAKNEPNADIGLTTFLTALPGVRTQTPKLDLHPRRFLLGSILVNEQKTVSLTIQNQGQGCLQGTVSITEGQDWLSFEVDKPRHESSVQTFRDQPITLHVHPRGIPANQSYGGKLTVVTNGGVVEVPLRMDMVAKPFPKAPLQGARNPQELADRIRMKPKLTVPLLESGEVKEWFRTNGWTYPVQGPEIKGVGGVQQLFEGMGLSKPPTVKATQDEISIRGTYPEKSHAEFGLQTSAKKWIYAEVTTTTPWLKVSTPRVSGPQQVTIGIEVETRGWTGERKQTGEVKAVANGGQVLRVAVHAEVAKLPRAEGKSSFSLPLPKLPLPRVPALVTFAFGFLLFRLLLAPIVDGAIRPASVASAMARTKVVLDSENPLQQTAGWLKISWARLLLGRDAENPNISLRSSEGGTVKVAEIFPVFLSYWNRWFLLASAWAGPILLGLWTWRKGGVQEVYWGVVAGTVLGLIVGATVGSAWLVLDVIPHGLFETLIGPASGWGPWLAWVALASMCWGGFGVVLGVLWQMFMPRQL